MKETSYYESPIGILEIKAEDNIIVSVRFVDTTSIELKDKPQQEVLTQLDRELDEYFEGKRQAFNVPFSTCGTDFQEKIWRNLQTIPYGQTRSYNDLAILTGKPKATRAVGNANGKNPLCLIIPCHRVIKKDGSIGGYAYGVSRKEFLLNLEQKNI